MYIINKIKKGARILYSGALHFFNKGLLSKSAALSYSAVFSLPPMLVLVISLFDFINFSGRKSDYVFNEISGFVGKKTASALKNFVDQISFLDSSGWEVYVSAGLVIFTATSVFAIVQTGMNDIFEVKREPSTWMGILNFVTSRLLSISLIVGLAVLMLMTLVFDVLFSVIQEYMVSWGCVELIIEILANGIIPLMLLAVFFSYMYKVLPDIDVSLREVWPAGIFTAILFVIGKHGIGYYVSTSNINDVYSNAASIVVTLVWCYYGSSLLFLGCGVFRAYLEENNIDYSETVFDPDQNGDTLTN